MRSFWWALKVWLVVRALKKEVRKGHDCAAQDYELSHEAAWRCKRCGHRLGDK